MPLEPLREQVERKTRKNFLAPLRVSHVEKKGGIDGICRDASFKSEVEKREAVQLDAVAG
jgi:hypothetical protein